MAEREESRDYLGIDYLIDYRLADLAYMDYLTADSFRIESLIMDSLICDSFSKESFRYSYSAIYSATDAEMFKSLIVGRDVAFCTTGAFVNGAAN